MQIFEQMKQELQALEGNNNLRSLPKLEHYGRYIELDQRHMLNLSSNDYLGLASDEALRAEFLASTEARDFCPSASASRLLSGNFDIHERLERLLADLYGTQAALTFGSGYHANSGILPAIAGKETLILADKLVHASIIDGMRLSTAHFKRYRHNDLAHLESLIEEEHTRYREIIVVTESVFSMDGDRTDLARLVAIKRRYPNVLLYVDEAHGVGVFGNRGLGLAEEEGCIGDIDFLVGTFGKALASTGAFVVCTSLVREYLVNKMRPFIFTTALPPVCVEWTYFILKRLPDMADRRQKLRYLGEKLRKGIRDRHQACPSESQIVPLVMGSSANAVAKAELLQRHGFYVLPVRPPTVPEGTSRIRFSLTASITYNEIDALIRLL